jgi:hypothetical protein
MGLTEVPSELFRMKDVKRLNLFNNKLRSLPSEIAHVTKLEVLHVRLAKRLDRWSDAKVTSLFRSTATSSSLFRPNSGC